MIPCISEELCICIGFWGVISLVPPFNRGVRMQEDDET
jgi:hypothetical protein